MSNCRNQDFMNKTEAGILYDLTSEIDFLRSLGYKVCLSCFDDCLAEHLPVLYDYEVHPCSVCYYLKRNRDYAGKCAENKARLNRKLPAKPYFASCRAGVDEWIFPVVCDDKTMMCLHLTGYRGSKRSTEKSAQLAARYGEDFTRVFAELSPAAPDEKTATRIITPLTYIAEALVKKCAENNAGAPKADFLYNEALRVMYDRFSEEMTAETVANAVGYSVSHLRHVFAAHKTTVSGELANIRLKKAAEMLKTTPGSVTEIAGRCGYSDPNYFSVAFSRKYGVSPREYRKN